MIRLSKASVGDQELQALSRVIDAGYLGMGVEVRTFEEQLVNYFGNGMAVACVNSGTAALHVAVQAIGCGPGDEVLVPSLTFVASLQAIAATGAKPGMCEVDYATGSIDLNDAEKRITKNTKAIMPVYYASYLANIPETYALAKKHNLRVVEDAAQAFGCRYQDKKIGSFGDVICFSFDGIKNITCGEGGAVVTSDLDVLEKIQDARLVGVCKDTEKRYQGRRSWDFDVKAPGLRYHMSDLNAAIGQVQLGRFESEFKSKRQELALCYRERLKEFDFLECFETDIKGTVPHILPIKITNGKRDEIRAEMQKQGIETGLHYKPGHMLSYFKTDYSLPVAEKIYQEIMSLPLQVELTEQEIDKAIQVLKKYK